MAGRKLANSFRFLRSPKIACSGRRERSSVSYLKSAYGAKEDCIGFLRQFKRASGVMTVSGIACATDVSPFHFKFFIKRIQYANSLFQNFRPIPSPGALQSSLSFLS